MTTITLNLDERFLNEIDGFVKKKSYHNRTEFIRAALREKLEETKLNEAMLHIAHLKGASKKRTTAEEFEKVRERAFDTLTNLK